VLKIFKSPFQQFDPVKPVKYSPDPGSLGRMAESSKVCCMMQNLLRVAWSPDGGQVSAGSGDRFVYIWDTTSRRILYKLPGHAGSVNEVDFHPFEPISK